MTSISVTSQKGGVGKTTLSVNLAYSFAKLGKTLLIDTDPNGSIGHLYRNTLSEKISGNKPVSQPKGIYNMLTEDNLSLQRCIHESHNNTPSLLFAGTVDAYQSIEEYPLADFTLGLTILLNQVRQLGYEYVIIDSAAGLFKPSRAAISSSDFSLIVQHPSAISDHTAQQGMSMYESLMEKSENLKNISIVLSMVDSENSHLVEKSRRFYDSLSTIKCMDHVIPKDDVYQRAAQYGYTVSSMPHSSSATNQLDQLRDEICRNITY